MLLTVVLTVLIFGVLITIHELGHFCAARAFGVNVPEFSLGMGPKLVRLQSKKPPKGDKLRTAYTLRLFPVGGYVRMEGEQSPEDGPRSFSSQKAWKRLIILAAGIFMNLLLGFLLLVGIYAFQPYLPTTIIAAFSDGATSVQSGLQIEDTVTAIDGKAVFTETDIVTLLTATAGTADITVSRAGEKLTLKDVSFQTASTDEGTSVYLDFSLYSRQNNFFRTVEYSAKKFCTLAVTIWRSLGLLLTGQLGVSDLSGPIGVGQAVGQTVQYGAYGVLLLTAFLTINVGLFNLLPIPALDGCQMLFTLIELIIRRPIPARFTAAVNAAGMALLILLMIFVCCKDFISLF